MEKFNVHEIKKDLFHDVLNKSADWVWRATPDAIFTYLSPSMKDLTGFEPEELIGKPFVEYAPLLLTEKSIQQVIDSLSKRRNGDFGNDVIRYDLVFKRKDGTEFVGKMCSSSVLNAKGEMVGIQGTTRDTTAQKLLVDELTHSIELFSTFFHDNNNPCCMTDVATGVVMYANASWLNNFDCSLDDIVGCTLSNLGLFEGAGLGDIIERVKASEDLIQSDITLQTKTGEEQFCRVTSFGVDIAGVERVFTSIVDNTNNLRIEEELSKLARFENVNSLVTDLALKLNNQLTGFTAAMNQIKTDKSDLTIDDYIGKTEYAARWLNDFAQELLALTKTKSFKTEFTDLEELLRQTVSLCLHTSQVNYKIIADPDLWHVNIVPEQIKEAINNLIINAKQAMPDGGSIVVTAKNIHSEDSVELSLKPGRYIEVSIADKGIGISDDIDEQIFDAFFSTREDGDGLGLTSARSIIEKHKGQIRRASTSGSGTTFNFYLPADSDKLSLKVIAGKEAT